MCIACIAMLAKSEALVELGLGDGIEPALQGFVNYLTNSSCNPQLFTACATPIPGGNI